MSKKEPAIPRADLSFFVLKDSMKSARYKWRFRVRSSPKLLFLALVLFCAFPNNSFGGVVPYAGAMGGIATLSADAGSQRVAQGLNLSSYAPANGGALDLFAGADLHDYFSLQGDFIWNRNQLLLNSSSATGAFYQQDRGCSQKAAIFGVLIYFRRGRSRIRPYLGGGAGVAHLSSAAERLAGSGGGPALPPAEFSWTGPVWRTHVGIDLRLIRQLGFRYSFSETIGHNEISKNLSPPGSRGLANFQNLFGFVVRF
jgi:hypothetical protein